LYPAGSNVMVTNVEQKTQRFVSVSENGNHISAMAVSQDRHVFAVAQKSSQEPSIHVYDLHTYRKRRKLSAIQPIPKSEFVSLAFSVDSKYLIAQTGTPNWTLIYYPWEKGKPLAHICSSPSPDLPVYHISINPFDSTEIFVSGKHFASIYRLIEGQLKAIPIAVPSMTYISHTWITIDRVVMVAQEGKVFLVECAKIIQEEPFPVSNTTISCIQATKHGFAVGSSSGLVAIYNFLIMESTEFTLSSMLHLPDSQTNVVGLAATTGEDTLLVEVSTNHIYKVVLSSTIDSDEQHKYEVFMESSHTGPISGLALCIRKPLIVTCSQDRSIRIWNYMTGTCEMVKFFNDEPQSVSLHPSGLYLLAGFGDKLRLMNILMDDLRPVREFSIRACKECVFSNGGHIFAAAHGNIVQIFSTWTFENIENLKGHNGKVKSLYWTPDDGCLVSSGSDGAVYTWNMKTMKREHEHILKSCSYYSGICLPNGRVTYAVGSDKMIKEIAESTVTKEFEANQIMTQIALSNSGRMLFVG
ncbi:quinon protein alcohol dehydrogenase-like superfamily, partial [Globomyces pollinis-pini]